MMNKQTMKQGRRRRFLLLAFLLPYFSVVNAYDLQPDIEDSELELFSEKSQEKGLLDYQSMYRIAIEQQDTLLQLDCLQQMSKIYFSKMEFSETLNLISRILYLTEHKPSDRHKAAVLSMLGLMYSRFGDDKTGVDYVLQGHILVKEGVEKDSISPTALVRTYLNLLHLSKRSGNTRLARSYLDSALVLSDSLNMPLVTKGQVAQKEATFLLEEGKWEEALLILKPLKMFYDSIYRANDNKLIEGGKTLLLVMANMARIYKERGNYDRSIVLINRTLRLMEESESNYVMQPILHKWLSEIYKIKGDYESAYNHLLKARNLEVDYFRASSKRNLGVLQLRNDYQEQLEEKERALLAQQLITADKEKALLRSRYLLLGVFLLSIAVFFIFKNKMDKKELMARQELLRQKADEEVKLSRLGVQYKNKELTTYALQLMERDDLLDQFVGYLEENDTAGKARPLINARRQMVINNWEEFEKRFVEVNEDFYQTLKDQFPDLTWSDLRYCALVKLDLKGKEISKLLGVTEKSVHMARYRLRKKFQLDTEHNLVDFLNRI